MSKHLSFNDNDKELVQKIREFQKAQELPHFVDAVRLLCKNGLKISDMVKNLKWGKNYGVVVCSNSKK